MPKISPSEAGSKRPTALEMFTDRVHEQELLREIMRPVATTAERSDFFLTAFYGVGGVGKSTLCRRAFEIAMEQDAKQLVLVTVDYDGSGWSPETAFVGVINELVRAFAGKGVSPRLSGSLLALYAQHDSRTGGESTSVDERWGLAMESLDKGVELAGIPGLGLLLKGAQWVKDRAQRGALQKQLRELGLWPEEQFGRVDLIDLEAKIGRALFEDVRNFLNDSPDRHVRLLIDGFERLQSHERKADAQMRLQDFLGYFAASKDPAACNRFRVLIFGREKLRWDELYDDDDWCRFWNQHLLAGLAERDARDFLGKYRQWFQTHNQQALAAALKDYEAQILDATDEQAEGQRMFYPFYLNLAVELLERSVSRGERPDLGRAPCELQDRFFKYIDQSELRALMILSLAEIFDEQLFDWLARERLINFPVHSFHTSLRREHSYFQHVEQKAEKWKFHRLFENALQSRWLVSSAARAEGVLLVARLLDYLSAKLQSVSEHDWKENEEELIRCGLFIVEKQGVKNKLMQTADWFLLVNYEPWGTKDSYYENHSNGIISKGIVWRTWFGISAMESVGWIRKNGDIGSTEAIPAAMAKWFATWVSNGIECPDTFVAISGLAKAMQEKGEMCDAEKLFLHAFNGHKRVCGPMNPNTLAIANDLGCLLLDRNDIDRALDYCRFASEGREQTLGEEHPDTLDSINNLGVAHCRKGAYRLAEELHRRVLLLREKTLGQKHPRTLNSAHNLVLALHGNGDKEAALEFLRKWIEVTPAYQFRYNLACYECLCGNLDEARRLLREEFRENADQLQFAMKDDDLISMRAELNTLQPK